jgi:hypothetical protein
MVEYDTVEYGRIRWGADWVRVRVRVCGRDDSRKKNRCLRESARASAMSAEVDGNLQLCQGMCMARVGKAGQGRARHGVSEQGRAGQGKARQGAGRQGKAWQGAVQIHGGHRCANDKASAQLHRTVQYSSVPYSTIEYRTVSYRTNWRRRVT